MASPERGYWLVKSEPGKYSWEQFVADGSTYWDGVRNYQARNNLEAMRKGDLVLFYHSVKGTEVVGIAKVARESYPDPTSDDPGWLVVDLKPAKAMKKAVTLAEVKADKQLADVALIRQSRLSVMPMRAREFARILELGDTRPPR